MISGLKPYPSMKESGEERLGKVPKHWHRCRIKHLFQEKETRYGKRDGTLLSLTRTRGIVPYLETSNRIQSAEDLSKYKVCNPGDLVMNRMQAWSGMFAVSPMEGVISPDYSIFRAKRADVHEVYFERLFKTSKYVDEFARRSKGIGSGFNRLYTPDFGFILTYLPPLTEQAAIVRYLNYVDRRISRLIQSKRKLIKLLEEQKQAIIHQAVTSGLDPNVPMKDSEVEWLGEVPEHWEVLRTKYIFQEVDSRSITGQETHLSMSQKLGLVPSDMVQSSLTSENYIGGKLCDINDLILNRLKAHLGVFAVAKQAGVISPDYTVFRRTRKINPKYFEIILRSPACRRELRIRAKGIVEGFWRLYTDDFYNIKLPFPPVEEQDLIIKELEEIITSIDLAINSATQEIELFTEYQTRLIADVVAGKLDVCEAAANLPDDESEDLESYQNDIPDEANNIEQNG